jgi:hypothetical protein
MSARLAPGSWFHSPQPAIAGWRIPGSAGIFASLLSAGSPLLFPISDRSIRLHAIVVRRALSRRRWP